jgi:hypothetical protein
MSIRRFFPSTIGKKMPSALLPNLVEYWKFDSSYLGEIIGASPTLNTGISLVSGKVNNGVEALASPAGLSYPNNIDYSFSNGTTDVPFSISMWVYIDSLSGSGNWLVSKRAISGTSDEYQITLNSSRNVVISLYDKSNRLFGITATANITQLSFTAWHHVVCTYDGSGLDSGLEIYIDGILQLVSRTTTGTYTGMPVSSTVLRFFRATNNNATIHFGKIDEAALWKNRKLTSSEVSQLYNFGLGSQYPF